MKYKEDTILWGITRADVECIAGKKLSQDELEGFARNFSIEDWSDHVDIYLEENE